MGLQDLENKTEFEYIKVKTDSGVKTFITACDEKSHFQQVVYSVHGKCLTVICFDCKLIVSNYQKSS